MDTALQSPVTTDRVHEELKRLLYLYGLCNLNARYYGCRAEKYEKRSRLALIASGLLSALTLALLLGIDPQNCWVHLAAGGLSGMAAVISAVTPFIGWTEKIRDLRNLNFAYQHQFGLVESAITEIRRAAEFTAEHVGLSRMVHEGYRQIQALDELEIDDVLRNREDEKVRQELPDDYVWTRF